MPAVRYLLSLLIVVSGYVCTAKSDDIFPDDDKTFDGRLIFGLNFTQVDGDSHAGFHNVGLNVGGMVYVHLSNSIGVSLEMLYTKKGSRGAHVKESYYVGTYLDKYYLNLKYAEIPLLFHLKRWQFFDYEVGVSYARLISSKEWGAADVPVQIFPQYNYFNNFDISYIAGFTVRMHKHWYGNVRFQYSATTIRPLQRVPERYNVLADQFNNAVTFRAYYRF